MQGNSVCREHGKENVLCGGGGAPLFGEEFQRYNTQRISSSVLCTFAFYLGNSSRLKTTAVILPCGGTVPGV